MKKYIVISFLTVLCVLTCACQSTQSPADYGVFKPAETTDADLYATLSEGVEFIAPTGYEDYWVVCDTSESTELAYFEYYGIYDKSAKEYVLECTLTEEPIFCDGLARFYEDGYYGYLNSKGEIAIAPQFTDCYDFKSGLAEVQMNSWGVIDVNGSFVISPQWEEVEVLEPLEALAEYYSWQPVGKGMIWVSDGECSGLYDFDGIEVIAPEYKNADFYFTESGIYAPYQHRYYYDDDPPICPTGDWYILFDYDGNNQMDIFTELDKARFVSLPKQGVHIVSNFLKDTEESIYLLYDENYKNIPEVVDARYTYISAFSNYNRAVVISASKYKPRLWSNEMLEDGFFLIDTNGNCITELPTIPMWDTYYGKGKYQFTYSANDYYVIANSVNGNDDYLIDLQTMEYTPWDMVGMIGNSVATCDKDTGLYYLFDSGEEIASNCTNLEWSTHYSGDKVAKVSYTFYIYQGNNCTEYTTDWQPYIPEE